MVHSPQQEFFSVLMSRLRNLYDVYDGILPSKDAKYPFVYMSDAEEGTDQEYKDAISASIYQRVHVWGDDLDARGDISAMLAMIHIVARNITETKSYTFKQCNVSTQMIKDKSTAQPLIHGIVEINVTAFRRN